MSGREAVVLFEHLGKRRRPLIADAGRDPGDGVVARLLAINENQPSNKLICGNSSPISKLN